MFNGTALNLKLDRGSSQKEERKENPLSRRIQQITEGDIGVCDIAVLNNFSCGISVILILNCGIVVFSKPAGCGFLAFWTV